MVDKSIAYRLSFYVSIAVILVFIVFIIVYFLLSQRLLRENIENRAIGLSAEVSALIGREVASVREATANVADQVAYYYSDNDLDILLEQTIKKFPNILAINVVLESGTPKVYSIIRREGVAEFTVQDSQASGDSSTLEAFAATHDMNPTGWSQGYFHSETEEPVVARYLPFEATVGTTAIRGYVSTIFSLESLNNTINEIEIGRNGFSFLIDSQGNFLTHPDRRKVLNNNLLALSQKILNSNNRKINTILSEGTEGAMIAFPEVLDFEKGWVYFSPVSDTPWFQVFTMPYHELFRDLYRVTLFIGILALTGISLLYFVVSVIIRRQIKPLTRIATRLSTFSSPFKLNTENEVKQVANSLEYLKVWFDQYHISREEDERNNLQHNRDLLQASEIQQSLIKTAYPAFPNRNDIDIHAIYKPARKVSGDLFDYFFVDDNNLIFTIGDVSGSGVPAAIFMSVCQTIIKKNAHLRHPKKIVEATNHELSNSNHHQFFLTLFLGILNVKTGILTYCNAAHTFPFILKASGDSTEVKSVHGLPLGLYSNKTYGASQLRLEPGDTIFLYTDGVYEALNEKNIASGNLWIQTHLSGNTNLSAKDAVVMLDKEIMQTEHAQKDDICLLAVNYKA